MITNLNLFEQKSLQEQEYILKYFFLIDTDGLIHTLSEKFDALNIHEDKNNISSKKVDALFQTIFDEIFTYAYRYVNYISTDTFAHSFFGEPYFPPENNQAQGSSIYSTLQNYARLQKLALFNFCISEGFFYFLEQDYFSKETDSFSPLTANYEDFFSKGFFSEKNFTKYKHKASDLYVHQKFYNHNCRIREADPNSLFYFIVNQLCFHTFKNNEKVCTNTEKLPNFANSYKCLKEKLDTKIYIPHIYKFPVYSYSDITSIHSLDRNLIKNSDGNRYTLINYQKLYDDIMDVERRANFTSIVDTYLFQTLNERYFGFSTFSYITDILNEISGSKSSKLSEFRSYKNSSIYSILKDLSTCPLIYSRNFFLFYALEALKYSRSPKTNYMKFTSEHIFRRSVESKELNEISLLLEKQKLIVSYFSTLNQITLPILSALWKIVLSHFEKNFLPNKLSDYFENYITNHFCLLTTDFIELSDNAKIKNCSETSFCSWSDFITTIETLCKENHNDSNGKAKKEENVPRYSDKFKNARNTALTQEMLHDFLLAPCRRQSQTSTHHFYSYFSAKRIEAAAQNDETIIIELDNFQHDQAKNIVNLFS